MSTRTTSQSAPLTFAQESLYFLDQLTQGLPVYHMPQAFRIGGPLDAKKLETAIAAAITRHSALRARFADTPRGPEQFAVPPENWRLPIRAVTESDLKSDLRNEIARPFDLACEAPFRAELFQLAPDEHLLFLMLHHIAGDMSSLGILYRDIAAHYDGQAVPEPALCLSEHAREQRAKPASSETVQFWRDHLNGFTDELDFPLDRFRPRTPSFRGAAIYRDLPADLVTSLRSLARKNRCSLYMLALAALQVLIHRYTSQERFAISTPFSDREDPRLENTIGYLIHLLPIPCEVRPGQTFLELVEAVRGRCLEIYSHHQISFRRILQELRIASDSPKPPLARVVFQYFPETARLELPGLECSPVQVHSETSKFDLCVSLWEHGCGITAELEYDTDIFRGASMERLARHFEGILRDIAENPGQPVVSIKFMEDRERAAILEFGKAKQPFPRQKTVHELFVEQARETPEAPALLFDSSRVTYRELDRRSTQLAHFLVEAGVKPGDFAGISLPRSPELIIALLAILKAGAAYVPFDSSYPRPRLEYLFKDANPRLLLTDSRHAHAAPPELRAILLDLVTDQIDRQPAAALDTRVAPESPAYMMYTSGSTGTPKGALIPHRAIVRLVKNANFASFSPNDVFLAFAPVSFDASTLEIWAPLLNGGAVAIYPPQFESLEQFEEVIQRHHVTSLWLTAGLFNSIIDRKAEALRDVRQLLAGGDVLSATHVRKAQAALPETTLINGYGPTENTTFTCCYAIPRDWPEDRSIPIGRPVSNTRVYILDEQLKPAPIGVPGELYAGGDGLSLGYWNKPELTARAFIDNPFEPGTRLYRTGDRARFLEDGMIEFLGRRDSQVKIRGFRIELGEIESAFRQLPGVADVAVIPQPDGSGGKILVAYAALKPGETATAEELRNASAALLPSQSCPSRIVLLPELPLGPNGKVDRAALPKPPVEAAPDRELAAPRNPVEARLLQIWEQILDVPRISVDDNFFHLGGESLRATRALSQINAAFNCRLGLPRLFEAPTVRQMARLVEKALDVAGPAPLRSRSHAAPQVISSEVSRMSEEDVDSLLQQLLSTNDPSKS